MTLKTAPTPSTPLPLRVDFIGYGLAIGGAALFSTKGIFAKLLYAQGVTAEATLALRMLVALPIYLAILISLLRRQPALRSHLTWPRLFPAMAVGALGYFVSSYLDFSGLAFVSAQYERLVLFTYPFFVLLFGVWFFGDRMNWKLVPAIALSYAGLLIIFGWNLAVQPEGLFVGTALVLGSAVTFALYQHFARRQMAIIGAGLFTCIGMSTAALLAIGQSLLLDGPAPYLGYTPAMWTLGLMLGVFGTVLPSFLLNTAISRIGPRATASTGSIGPICTIALAVFVLGETFTPYHALGTALVLLGAGLFARLENRARSAKA